jgi:membrane protein DedA with SNARE-associated domain
MLSPDTIHHLLGHYGYPVLFLLVAAEGPIATIIGGFIASQGILDAYAVYAIALLGDLAGDLAYYAIGRFSRLGRSAGLWHRLGISEEQLVRAIERFRQHGAKILMFAKYTQTGIIVLPASGAARMPVARFLWFNALGSLPKTLALVLAGYYFGAAYNRINDELVRLSILLGGAALLALSYALLRQYLRAGR